MKNSVKDLANIRQGSIMKNLATALSDDKPVKLVRDAAGALKEAAEPTQG